MADETSTEPTTETTVSAEPTESTEPESSGETDYQSRFEAQRKVNRDLETKLKNLYEVKDHATQLEEQLAKLQGREKEFEAERQTQAIKDEALKSANQRVLKAEIRAAASGKLADPNDALRFVDLSKFTVGDDGEVDSDAIGSAISELLASKPYLGAKDTQTTGIHITPPSGRRDGEKPTQLTRADLKTMTPAEIVKAQNDGRLEELLHPSN